MSIEAFKNQDNRIHLKSSRLQVSILKPGKAYQNPRFDWTGFIADITLDGLHHFSAPHMDEAHTVILGQGLCNEFGMNEPVGRDESGPYTKIGIGLLPEGTDPKTPSIPLSDITPYSVEYKVSDQQITFHSQPLECSGYAVDYHKTITLSEDSIQVSYDLKNVGTKTIITDEYSHNFVLVNDYPIGPDYQLDFPYDVEDQVTTTTELTKYFTNTDLGLTWSQVPDMVYYFRKEMPGNTLKGQWQLRHKPTGIGMEETTDFEPKLFALWGESHVVSPELFYSVNLEPGARARWTRSFRFFSK